MNEQLIYTESAAETEAAGAALARNASSRTGSRIITPASRIAAVLFSARLCHIRLKIPKRIRRSLQKFCIFVNKYFYKSIEFFVVI